MATKAHDNGMIELLEALNSLYDAVEEDISVIRQSLDLVWLLNKDITYTSEEHTGFNNRLPLPRGSLLVDINAFGGNTFTYNKLFKYYGSNRSANGVDIRIVNNSINAHGTYRINADGGVNLTTPYFPVKRDGRKYLMCANQPIGSWKLNGYQYQNKQAFIFSANDSTDWPWGAFVIRANDGDVINIEGLKFEIFDLTEMFGAGNEPGVDELMNSNLLFAEEYADGTVFHSRITEIRNSDSSIRISIPNRIKSMDGYGWRLGNLVNAVDLNTKQYIQRIQRAKLADLTPSLISDYSAKQNLNTGLYLYYELDTPIVTDVSETIGDLFKSIKPKENDTLEFVSETYFDDPGLSYSTQNLKLPVYNSKKILISLANK